MSRFFLARGKIYGLKPCPVCIMDSTEEESSDARQGNQDHREHTTDRRIAVLAGRGSPVPYARLGQGCPGNGCLVLSTTLAAHLA